MSRSSKPKALSLEWTKGTSGKEKDDLEATIRHSVIVLSRLQGIIDDKLDSLERLEVDSTTYENPAYAYTQAHVNGKRASLLEIRRLLDFLT